ncbi:hypothetical protein LTSEMIN_1812 [Salmonella enterica subsp. enterica serovar Minnesota str. A4-603]|nr:hypothetical protein LTSEMIN_1812 [Salmonella enterica subsp. enterica serovar Minnesota str. A4-603]
MMSAFAQTFSHVDMMSARYAFGDQHDAQSFCLKHYFF